MITNNWKRTSSSDCVILNGETWPFLEYRIFWRKHVEKIAENSIPAWV